MSCYKWQGDHQTNVVFIFSTPGQEEAHNNRPVAGETGTNMNNILNILKQNRPDIFPSTCRYFYRISNAYTEALWREKDNRSEADCGLILSRKNIERIICDVGICQYVILSGRKAQLLRSHVDHKNIVQTCHFGWVGLRNTYQNGHSRLSGCPNGRARDQMRISLCAEEILKQL